MRFVAKVKYYRKLMGYTQKENGKIRFGFDEMRVFKLLVNRYEFPEVTIDDIFFNE